MFAAEAQQSTLLVPRMVCIEQRSTQMIKMRECEEKQVSEEMQQVSEGMLPFAQSRKCAHNTLGFANAELHNAFLH
jgi:hypothetical protein